MPACPARQPRCSHDPRHPAALGAHRRNITLCPPLLEREPGPPQWTATVLAWQPAGVVQAEGTGECDAYSTRQPWYDSLEPRRPTIQPDDPQRFCRAPLMNVMADHADIAMIANVMYLSLHRDCVPCVWRGPFRRRSFRCLLWVSGICHERHLGKFDDAAVPSALSSANCSHAARAPHL